MQPIFQPPDAPVFFPPDELALRIPLPVQEHFLVLGCDHQATVGLLTIAVPKGFACDAASIPRILRVFLPLRILFLIDCAGIYHDYLTRVQPCSRWQADAAFRAIMDALEVPTAIAVACWLAVRAFGWRAWRRYSVDSVLRENRSRYAFNSDVEGIHSHDAS